LVVLYDEMNVLQSTSDATFIQPKSVTNNPSQL